MCLLAGFTEKHGLVNADVVTGKVDHQVVIKWIKGIKLDPSEYFILLDNWSPHFAKNLLKFTDSKNIKLVSVPVYTPALNGAEGCFSSIRRRHNQLRLENVVNNSKLSNKQLMRLALK